MPATAKRTRRKATPCPCQCGQATAETTRLRKAECPSCSYVVRISREWIAKGLPSCPCGETLTLPCSVDRLSVPALEADAWAELSGRDDERATRSEYAKRAAARRRRCKLDGCSKWTGKGHVYCADHSDHEMPF